MSDNESSKEELNKDSIQTFKLIDTVIPFEVCLYHQVIPISLENNNLKLGMVNHKDHIALDYIRRILAYLNCKFKIQQISSYNHHALMTSYLNYNRRTKGNNEQELQPLPQFKPVKEEEDFHEKPTLILDKKQNSKQSYPSQDRETLIEKPKVSEANLEVQRNLAEKVARKKIMGTPVKIRLEKLEIMAKYLSQPIELLANLSSREILQELLARVLDSGIGRLYFENHGKYGRILWSRDGILQSVLNELEINRLAGIINEFKKMGNVTLIPVQQSQQIEIDRMYKDNHLLLILRLIPGKHGEEATLQVLRGAALKFYQQQQMTKLGEETLNLTEQIQRKLAQICDLANMTSTPLEKVTVLNQIMNNLEEEIDQLKEQMRIEEGANSV